MAMATISMTAPDQAMTDDVLCRLDADPRVDAARLGVECESGRVTLTGSVPWMYQKLSAEFDARAVPGVRAVDNRIAVHSAVLADDVLNRIAGGAAAHGRIDAHNVRVDVSGRLVTLLGTVPSWVGREVAERAAWRTPGVADVHNRIEIAA
jgi:osmotically-inducible protein OsmY